MNINSVKKNTRSKVENMSFFTKQNVTASLAKGDRIRAIQI